MKNITYKASALIISLSLLTPLLVSAQSVSSSTDISAQVQSLMSQITALESQLRGLLGSNSPASSSMAMMPEMPPQGIDSQATSTPPMMGGQCPQITRNLSVGSSGPDVSQLQDVLAGSGFLSASSTGFFGPMTARALMRFQSSVGIATSTGVAGPLTRNFIQNHCNPHQGPGGPAMQGGMMGAASSSLPWNSATTTMQMRMMPPGAAGQGTSTAMSMNGQSGTGQPQWMHGIQHMQGMGMQGSMMGTTTAPQPCMQGAAASTTGSMNNSGGAAAPHTMAPGMMPPPCPSDVSGEMQQQ